MQQNPGSSILLRFAAAMPFAGSGRCAYILELGASQNMTNAVVSFDVSSSFYWVASFGRTEAASSTFLAGPADAAIITVDPADDTPAYLRVSLFETTFPTSRSIKSRGNALVVVPGGTTMTLSAKPSGKASSSINTIVFPSGRHGVPLSVHAGTVADSTLDATLAEKKAETEFRRAIVATADPKAKYLREYLREYVDYSYCGFSGNFSGLHLPRAFKATPAYAFRWLLEATSLFLYLNPLSSLEGAGESLWTNILTAAAGPYEMETIDARDTPIILSGIGDDCDGATMIAGDLHLYAHEARSALESLVSASAHPCAPALRCALDWAWTETEPTPALMVCNADPDVRLGAVTTVRQLREAGLHEALLLKRRGRGFSLVETTCFSVPSTRAAAAPGFLVPFDPRNSMGYNQMKPFSEQKYPNVLTVQQGNAMWVSKSTDLLPISDVLSSDLATCFRLVPIPLRRTAPVSHVPNLGADDALNSRLRSTASPGGVLTCSGWQLIEGTRTPRTTALPGYAAAKLPTSGPNIGVAVGPFSWILAEFDGTKYLGRTPVKFSGKDPHTVL